MNALTINAIKALPPEYVIDRLYVVELPSMVFAATPTLAPIVFAKGEWGPLQPHLPPPDGSDKWDLSNGGTY